MGPVKQLLKNKVWGSTGSGPRPTDDLTHITRDSLFSAQLRTSDPTALTVDSLRIAKICETDHYARSVMRTLTKSGIIDPTTGHPDTTKIDRTLVSNIAILSVPKQRELVNMLFFWEEELMRWRLLDEEADEIQASAAVCDPAEVAGLQERLAVVRAKKLVVPSLRMQDGTLKVEVEGGRGGGGGGGGEEPPAYSD